ncbi:cell wall-binding protein [Methylobacter sp. BlB1]|uniref:cell wall-binding protein n=1 Tax=Methylobacter sp. BlB1 TaxID=2785914 RepID=UPI0018948FB9|nr:cell wall-binding protein [Methylobacter sp. BlB1]MBF6648951.1 cell wall-binding protein [Methylobacter sp. BlB1]
MTNKTEKPVLEIVKGATKPTTKKTGGSGPGKEAAQHFGDYAIISNAFHQIKSVRTGPDGQGFVEIPLCDFVCQIIEEVTQDDGLQDQSFLRIEGRRKDGLSLPMVDVPANKFYSTQANWVNEHYGTLAFVYPGASKRDNLRAAIHLYSKLQGDVPRRRVFRYTGWKRINDQWHYLTGSGAITASGLHENVQVDLGAGHMSRYALPAPCNLQQVKEVLPIVLRLLAICPGKPHIGAALLATVARAPLGECHPTDFALFIHGVTGAKKSAITAIPLAFFGDFNARRFPANFSDTDNDLEAKAFQVKDGIFVIDDFKPSVNQSEAAKVHAKAERLIRNTGNQAGRGRRGSDMQAKAAPYNRSMTLITGEDLPKGQSLLGRLLILELTRADVDTNTLTKLQEVAEAGQLARFMAAYLQWLAPRLDDLKKQFPQAVTSFRNAAIRDGFATSHPRAPEIYANLVAGAELLLDFMTDIGALDSETSSGTMLDIERYLQGAFTEQAAYQHEQDEVERFLELLRASFASGNAHIACRLNQGPPPSRPHAWGWRSDVVDMAGDKIYKPTGDCIGWYCDKQREVWLEQNAAFAVAQRLAKMQGDAFLLSPPSLWRRMGEKGLVLATEARANGTKQLNVKRVIGGRSKRVMILSADLIESG